MGSREGLPSNQLDRLLFAGLGLVCFLLTLVILNARLNSKPSFIALLCFSSALPGLFLMSLGRPLYLQPGLWKLAYDAVELASVVGALAGITATLFHVHWSVGLTFILSSVICTVVYIGASVIRCD